VWPQLTFGRLLWPGLSFSPHARAEPKAAAAGDEEVGLPGELVMPQYAVVPSQIIASRLMAAISPPTSRL
jgi:hypothetical protein